MKIIKQIIILLSFSAIFCSCNKKSENVLNNNISNIQKNNITSQINDIKIKNSSNTNINNYYSKLIIKNNDATSIIKYWQLGAKIKYSTQNSDTYIDNKNNEIVIIDLNTKTGSKMPYKIDSPSDITNPFLLADSVSKKLNDFKKISNAKIGDNDCTIYEYTEKILYTKTRIYISNKYNIILKWEMISPNNNITSYEFADFKIGCVKNNDVTVPKNIKITDMKSIIDDLE